MGKTLRSKRFGVYAIFWLLVVVGVLSATGWSYFSASRARHPYNGWDQDQAPDQIGVAPGSISISTEFEGAQRLSVREISPTHFWIIMGEHDDPSWFAFEVRGAAGKTVSFDIMVSKRPDNWTSINPVFSYLDSYELGNPDSFECRPLPPGMQMVRFPNRAKAPPTDDIQKWQFIEKSSLSDDGLHFTQHFAQSPAIVAMTYPLVARLNTRLLDDAAKSPLAKLITLGTSAKNRPLQILRIATDLPAATDHRPTVAVVARDNGNNQDGGWVAWGMIHFLLSDDPVAQDACNRAIFAFMPCVDPDSAASGTRDEQMVEILNRDNKRPEPRNYAVYFNKLREAGHTPALVIYFGPPRYPIPMQIVEGGYYRSSPDLPALFKAKGLIFDTGRWEGYYSENSGFASWFAGHFGAQARTFVIDSQCSAGHMTLGQLQDVGECLVRSADAALRPPSTQPARKPAANTDDSGE